MPTWRVTEPFIDLWLFDTPLTYNTAIAGRMSLSLSYHQHETRSDYPDTFGFGNNWGSPWSAECQGAAYGDFFTVYGGGGGLLVITNDGVTLEPQTKERGVNLTNNVGDVIGYIIIYPDGAQDIYGLYGGVKVFL